MSSYILKFLTALALYIMCIPNLAHAEDSLGNAISQTKLAIEEGRAGHLSNVVGLSEKALHYVMEVEKSDKNKKLKEAQHCLEEAIDHGENGHVEQATKHAQDALKHLQVIWRWRY